LSRLEENMGSETVELTAEDLREIDRVASQIAIRGARYPEQLEKSAGL
jgi:aryl-alcohol dehydrogenase-like predicted oxidoreductase